MGMIAELGIEDLGFLMRSGMSDYYPIGSYLFVFGDTWHGGLREY